MSQPGEAPTRSDSRMAAWLNEMESPTPVTPLSLRWRHWIGQLGVLGSFVACYGFGVTRLPDTQRDAEVALGITAILITTLGIYLRFVVASASEVLFHRRVAQPDRDRRYGWWRFEGQLLREASGGVGLIACGALALLLLPLFPFVGPLVPDSVLPPLLVSLVAVAVTGFVIFVALCSSSDYLTADSKPWKPIAKPFAGKSVMGLLLGGIAYVLLIGILALELEKRSVSPTTTTAQPAAQASGDGSQSRPGQPVYKPTATATRFFLPVIHLLSMFVVLELSWRIMRKFRGFSDPSSGQPGLWLVIAPLAIVAVNVFVTTHPINQWNVRMGVGWAISVVPLMFGLPYLAVASLEEPTIAWAARLHIDLIRAKLVLFSIVERDLPAYAISLPLSVALGAATILDFEAAAFDLRSLWLAVTAVWLGPLLLRLYFIEETFEAVYTTQLRRCMQRLRKHVLVMGYGDIGRRYVRELLQSGVVSYSAPYEHIAFARNILLPSGRLAKVLTRIVAIESDAAQVDGVVRPPGHASVGRADVTRIVQRLSGLERDAQSSMPVDYIIPVVVADASSDEIQNLSEIEHADFVACLIRPTEGRDRSQAVFEKLNALAEQGRRAIPAAFALRSSTYPPYFVERIIQNNLPVHYILPSQLEGLNAANLLHALYRRDLNGSSSQLQPILICGRGKRLFYLIDSFLKALGMAEYEAFATCQNSRPVLVMMTTDDDLKGTALPAVQSDFPEWKTAGSADPKSEPRFLVPELKERHEMRVLRTQRHVTRSPKDPDDKWPVGGGSIRIPIIPRDSRDYPSMYEILELLRPDTVLVSDHEADDEFRSINAIATSVARLVSSNSIERAPLLMVTGETGRSYLESNFQRAMVYYQSLGEGPTLGRAAVPKPVPPRTFEPFPDSVMEPSDGSLRLSGDPLIDVLEDPVERLVGLTGAYLQSGMGQLPVEINFCVSDSPGSLATTLAKLAGLEIEADKPLSTSFTNSRFVADRGEGFMVRSFMELDHRPEPLGDSFVRAAVIASDPENASGRARAASVASKQPLRRGILPLLLNENNDPLIKAYDACCKELTEWAKPGGAFVKDGQVAQMAGTYVKEVAHCCGMPTCPVEAVNKVAVPMMSNRVLLSPHRAASVMSSFVSNIGDRTWNVEKAAAVEQPVVQRRADRPLAYVRIKCGLMRRRGSFAVALNALLLRRVSVKEGTAGFDFTYLSSYECHDQRFGVFTCYGRRLPADQNSKDARLDLHPASVVHQVDVRPVTHAKRWEDHARDVAEFLSRPDESGKRRVFHVEDIPGGRGWTVKPVDATARH